MKRNIIKQAAVLFLATGLFTSCSKSFLQLDPKGEFQEDTYYKTPDQAFAGLVSCYAPLTDAGGGIDGTYTNLLGPMNSAADECMPGGGNSSDMDTWQAIGHYNQLTPQKGPQGQFWGMDYEGIYRCNVLLTKLEGANLDAATLSRYTAEAKFLRAYYYFELVRLFKNIILTTEPLSLEDNPNVKQTSSDSVYAQIEKDLIAALPSLPATVTGDEKGRITQGAGIALLGKVYLYEKKWTDAATQFAKVNGPTPGGTTPVYGYKLMANYADIFSPDHKFNTESIFELVYTGTSKTDWGNWFPGKGNVYVNMVGPRSYTGPTYFGGGWSFNPIDTLLVQFMHPSPGVYDPRYKYTVANIDSLTKATGSSYLKAQDNSGYFIQKFAPLQKYKVSSGTAELNFPNDIIVIRLADTYLMEAEALVQGAGNTARAQKLLDAVRARVGLPSEPVTLDNIYKERHLELATEGVRWFDLVRTGKAASVLAYKGFTAGTNELLPIPYTEFQFNKNLVQNPGYHN